MGFTHGHQYTAEEVDFIIDNYKNFDIKTLSVMFNNLFPPGVSIKALKARVRAIGVTKRKLQDNYGTYTQEMLDWLCEAYNSKEYANFEELTKNFNRRFGTNFTRSAIWHKTNRTLNNQIVRKSDRVMPRVAWTQEMIEYLKENLDKCSYNTLAKEMSTKFKCYITSSSIEHKASRMGLKKDLSKVANYAVPNLGRFKKGKISPKRAPLGYERIDSEGSVWIKYAHPDKFMRKARWVYIQCYGEIDDNVNIVQVNGNKMDFRIENLRAFTNSELAYFNTTKINPNGNDEAALIKLDVADINKKIKEKKRNAKK
ncbi:MAG: HNH endonuclease signature motif containing protein [Anaeroplasma sp.]